MARVTYTADQLRKRGISIVKDPTLKLKPLVKDVQAEFKNKKNPLEQAMKFNETWPEFKHIDDIPRPGHKWIFPITPIPAPRMTQGQLKLLHIHDVALTRTDLATKRRLQKYFSFKEALAHLAKKQRFKLPDHGFHITFYLPHRLKGPELEDTPHQQKPDLDNLVKAFKDALSAKDQIIWDYRISKRWTIGDGRIQVTLL